MSSFEIGVAVAPLNEQPRDTSRLASEVLYGEAVEIQSTAAGWAHLRRLEDGYEGYCPDSYVRQSAGAPTHLVATLGSFLYAEPALKSPIRHRLSFLSRVEVTGWQDDYAQTREGFLHKVTLTAVDEPGRAGVVEVARRFIDIPYKWGGRSSLGMDCSALIQLCFAACGITIPRDTGPQGKAAMPVAIEDTVAGDLIFSPGHVMLVSDRGSVIHANAFWMRVVEEDRDRALARLSAEDRKAVTASRVSGYIHPQ